MARNALIKLGDCAANMNNLISIEPEKLAFKPVQQWNEWLLLSAGDFATGQHNCMTVAWGSFGVMWGRPFAQVVVRPTRHTYGFIEKWPDFTLTAFAPEHKDALMLLGSMSGRDGDKIAEAGLTPRAAQAVCAPTFQEAELSIECRTLFSQDFDPKRVLDPEIHNLYDNDYHRQYFGEIIAAEGLSKYSCES